MAAAVEDLSDDDPRIHALLDHLDAATGQSLAADLERWNEKALAEGDSPMGAEEGPAERHERSAENLLLVARGTEHDARQADEPEVRARLEALAHDFRSRARELQGDAARLAESREDPFEED